jgi:hypothetical protein
LEITTHLPDVVVVALVHSIGEVKSCLKLCHFARAVDVNVGLGLTSISMCTFEVDCSGSSPFTSMFLELVLSSQCIIVHWDEFHHGLAERVVVLYEEQGPLLYLAL